MNEDPIGASSLVDSGLNRCGPRAGRTASGNGIDRIEEDIEKDLIDLTSTRLDFRHGAEGKRAESPASIGMRRYRISSPTSVASS